MDEELAFHVEMETERLRKEGLSPAEARRRALASFGGLERYREEMRYGRPTFWLHDIWGDLRYAARMLRKHKAVTAIAIISLAIGIGANSAIFSLVNTMLLRPRAVSRPEELVQIYSGDREQPFQSISYPSFIDFRQRNNVLTDLAAYSIAHQFKLSGTDDVDLVWGEAVSASYFDVLGVHPLRGRTFAPDEDRPSAAEPVVVISYGLWQRRFGSDPALIGRTIVLNRQRLTVIGIVPPSYTGMMSGWASEVWVPTAMMSLLEPAKGPSLLTNRGSKWLALVGRLKAGVTIGQARTRFELMADAMRSEQPDEWQDGSKPNERRTTISVVPERETRIHPAMQGAAFAVAGLVFVIVNLVLLIACMNLAGMLFARGVARRGEIAVRLALGASRSRVVRQLLTESLLLALIAGVAGIVLAGWSLSTLVTAMPALPEGIRLAVDVRLDWRVVGYTTTFACLTGVLFGLAPALHASRSAVWTVLKDDAAAVARAFRLSWSRRALVVGQVAFSVVLLIGAGLLLRSLDRIRPTSLGFASENVLVAPIALDEASGDRTKTHQFYEQLSREVGALPGVRSVSLVEGIPGGFLSRTRRSTEIEGYVPSSGEDLEIDAAVVGPHYFTNMQVPVTGGRDFDERDRDGAACVVIVNEAFADKYVGGVASALGRHLARRGSAPGQKEWCTIVGVIRDNAWQSLQRQVRPFFAAPLLQADKKGMTLLVSSSGAPAGLTAGVKRVIRTLDADVPVKDVAPLAQFFEATVFPFRLLGFVVAGCGAMAMILATIGVYGTIAYSVAQRRREVSIRMALGAMRRDVLRLIIGQGMVLVGLGLLLGLALGATATRVLTSLPLDTTLLFGVSPTDAVTFAGVTVLLTLVGVTACYLPARAATTADPAATLRST